MSFPAKYKGICSKCKLPIDQGSLISWNRKQRGQVYHAACGNSEIKTEGLKELTELTQEATKQEEAIPMPKEEKIPSQVNLDPLSSFVKAIAPMISAEITAKIDDKALSKMIDERLKDVTRPIEIKLTNGKEVTVNTIKNPHEKMQSLLYFISKRKNVYLYGPAGSGKSTAAHQVSQALNLNYGYLSLNPQTPDSRILGFIDAGGTYRSTPFFQCYKDGGVFCIDEMDNASAALLTTLNSMLENGRGAFPCGLTERHKDFVLVATGNTNGRGGNPAYPERRAFDAAFAERFTYLQWNYDESLERLVTLAINPQADGWLTWVQKVRKFCQSNHPRVLVSPRASFLGAEYLLDSGMETAVIAEAVLFKGLDGDTVRKIVSANPFPKAV